MGKFWLKVKTLFYLAVLSVTGLPLCICLMPAFIYSFLSNYVRRKRNDRSNYCKTVLVTGAPHTKGLQICRILGGAGHRVILADMEKFQFSAARFSGSVWKWETLPNYSPQLKENYKQSVKEILVINKVDWWIPVSHTVTAVVDTEISEELASTNSKVKVLLPDSAGVTRELDNKLTFLKQSKQLGLPVTDFYEIRSCDDVMELCVRGVFDNRHYFLKSLSPYSEDRVCFTRLPSCPRQLATLLKQYAGRISPERPYFVTEFVRGEEYTGNAICHQGRILIFATNKSSPVQIDYQDYSHKIQVYTWVNKFIESKRLTGSFCFDFIEDESTGKMQGIECNPRLHSNIVLFHSKQSECAAVLYRALEEDGAPIQPVAPVSNQPVVIWLYNEIAKLWSWEWIGAMQNIVRGKDAVWDIDDPLPFLLLPHLQVPSLLWSAFREAEDWSMVNYCLGQVR